MNETINIVPLRQPGGIDDPLTNILRAGARQLFAQAVECEAETFLAAIRNLKQPSQTNIRRQAFPLLYRAR